MSDTVTEKRLKLVPPLDPLEPVAIGDWAHANAPSGRVVSGPLSNEKAPTEAGAK